MDMINEIGRWLQEKEVLPTALERLGMADKLAEIVLISLGITVLLGILSCFFGLKLARFWSFLTVFVIGTGAAAAVAMQITSDETNTHLKRGKITGENEEIIVMTRKLREK